MSFFEKFFGYFRYADSEGVLGLPEPYKDGLGDGAFSDIRHILWIDFYKCGIIFRIFFGFIVLVSSLPLDRVFLLSFI